MIKRAPVLVAVVLLASCEAGITLKSETPSQEPVDRLEELLGQLSKDLPLVYQSLDLALSGEEGEIDPKLGGLLMELAKLATADPFATWSDAYTIVSRLVGPRPIERRLTMVSASLGSLPLDAFVAFCEENPGSCYQPEDLQFPPADLRPLERAIVNLALKHWDEVSGWLAWRSFAGARHPRGFLSGELQRDVTSKQVIATSDQRWRRAQVLFAGKLFKGMERDRSGYRVRRYSLGRDRPFVYCPVATLPEGVAVLAALNDVSGAIESVDWSNWKE